MSERNSWLRAAVALPLVLLVACTEAVEPGAPLDADAPAIERDVVRLRSGERQALSLERGAGTVAWLVLDEDVATVDQAGVLRAGSPGMTWALAVTAAARDSVRVVVSFDDIVDGGVAFSLGHSSASLQLKGVSRIFRAVHEDYGFTEITGSVNPDEPADVSIVDLYSDEDTLVVLKLDDEPAAGFREVTPWEVTSGPNGEVYIYGREGAFVWMRLPDDPDHAALYVPVTPLQIEIDASEIPTAVGPATGRLTGRVSFDAAGLLVQLGPGGPRIIGQVSPDIVPFFAEFDLAQRIRPIGGGRLTVSGGPVSLSTTIGGVNVGMWNGGLVLRTGYHGAISGEMGRHHLWVGTPAVGTFDVPYLAFENFFVGDSVFAADRVSTFTETGMLSDRREGRPLPNIGLSESGRLTITRFDAPGPDTWGFFEATLEAQQHLEFGAPGAMQTVTMDVLAPIMPANDTLWPGLPPAAGGLVPGVRVVSNGAGQIHGRVFAGTEPVVNVTMTLDWNGGTASVRTNEIGHFRFMGLHPGQYAVSFDVPSGYALAEGQATTLGPLEVTPDQHPSVPVFVPIDLVRSPIP
jgi:hypothetical protein